MRRRGIGWAVALGMLLASSIDVAAEIYVWTDAEGVVHMTDQWAKVPEDRRAHMSVRESVAAPAPVPPSSHSSGSQNALPQVQTFPQPQLQVAPEASVSPVPDSTSSPPTLSDGRDDSWFIPRHRTFIHSPRKVDPPFPHNVRLDPHDPNFVWVGPNRVPKDFFTYPRIPLEKQAQFQQRLRKLERQRSSYHHQPTRHLPRR
jgi:Domain of unknown function (DUF4124)